MDSLKAQNEPICSRRKGERSTTPAMACHAFSFVMSASLDETVCAAIVSGDYETLYAVMPLIEGHVGICREVVILKFDVAEKRGDLAGLKNAVSLAVDLNMIVEGVAMSKKVAAKLADDGCYLDAIAVVSRAKRKLFGNSERCSLDGLLDELHACCIKILEDNLAYKEAAAHAHHLCTIRVCHNE